MTRVDEITDWPERLRLALVTSSRPYTDLLSCLDLPADGGWLSEALSGRLTPSLLNLAELSTCAGVPLAILMGDAPRSPNLAMTLRAGLAVVEGDTAGLSERAQEILSQRELLLSWFPDERDHVETMLVKARRAVSREPYGPLAATRTAEKLRDLLDLGDAPLINLVSIVENLGVPVLLQELPSTLQGLTIRNDADPNRASVVFVNSDDWWGRQRYTLAHELCHVLFDDPGVLFIESKYVAQTNYIEYRCEVFARHFLAPSTAVRAFWQRNQVEHPSDGIGAKLGRFMLEFGVSRRTALNVFKYDLDVEPDMLESYKDAPVDRIMRAAGLSAEWHEACLRQSEQSTSGWMLQLALKAYDAKLVGASVVAGVMDRQDVDEVEQELRDSGWGAAA